MKKFLLFLLCAFVSTQSFGASYPPITSKGTGLAVSTHELADAIGQRVLDSGGNAIDAAVAVGYALSVVHPAAGNIGGGGFALIHLANGQNIALDFREVAPKKATRDMYLDKNGEVVQDLSVVGYLAAGVPGTVKGMSAMLDKYGTRKLKDLIAPSIELAEKGFAITERQAQTMLEARSNLAKFASSRKYFLKPDSTPYKQGEKLVQKDLAKTLRLIADKGPDAFYKGEIATLIEADMKKNGGIITKDDLASYEVVWRKPVEGTYRGYKILSMSPPSSGGTHIIQILNTIENTNIAQYGYQSSQAIHIIAEAMRQAYADRSEYMGDPAFVKIPLDKLLSKEYAKEIYSKIKPNATPSSEVKPGLGPIHEGNNTTHYSVADKWGNAVSVTYTINGSFGAYAAIDGAGFLLNNEMDDFSIKPGVPNQYGLVGGDANAIAPGKRPLSSMSPTIVLDKSGKLYMVVGSPGGARIITTVLQVIINVIDYKMDIARAVESSRFHLQWLPDELRLEAFGLGQDTKDNLTKMGYKLVELPDMGDVNAILIDSGKMQGAHDPRTEF